MKALKYILFAAVLMLSACTKKVQKTETVHTVRDSISVVEKVKLDTLMLPGDTLVTTFTIECDSATNKPKPFSSTASGKNTSQSVALDANGQLKVESIYESMMHIVASIQKQVYQLQKDHKKEVITNTVEVKYIPWYFKAAFALSLIIIGVKGIKLLIKPYFPFI